MFLKLSIILIIIFITVLKVQPGHCTATNSSKILQRAKRYLDFLDKSRMFFRVNCKLNILQVNQIFSHSYGFRANMPIETDHKHYFHGRFRRDIFKNVGDLIDLHGLDGRACILKSFCEAIRTSTNSDETKPGMLFKIFKLIFTLPNIDRTRLPYLKEENCGQILHQHCPFSFNTISPFTDDL